MKRQAAALVLSAALAMALGADTEVAADQIAGSGGFVGKSGHVASGGASMVRMASGRAVIILDDDFSLDGAPDPRVGLGVAGRYDPATDMGALRANTGLQVFVAPDGVDVSQYDEVYIWCRQFSVPLGVAALK